MGVFLFFSKKKPTVVSNLKEKELDLEEQRGLVQDLEKGAESLRNQIKDMMDRTDNDTKPLYEEIHGLKHQLSETKSEISVLKKEKEELTQQATKQADDMAEVRPKLSM